MFTNEYEQFIISGFREETLSTMIPGSDAEKYLKIVRKIANVSRDGVMPPGVNNILFIIS